MLRAAFALCFGLLLGLAAMPGAIAQPMPQTAAQLTARISSLLPRRTIASLDLQNQSTLPATEWSTFRSQFEAELRKAGIEVTDAASVSPRVRITLVDSSKGPLFVAEVVSGDSRQIAMLRWNPPVPALEKPRIILTKKLLLTQPEPILDLLLLDSDSEMLVLDTNKVASYNLSGGNWIPGAAASLVLPRPIPRDPRGRLEAASDGFRAYLPGATCTGVLQPELKVTCEPGNETWPDAQVRWVTDRNVLESDAVKGSFYTATNGIFAMAQGQGAGAEAWGSDIAAVDDPCGGGAAVLATSTATDRDSVRAYHVRADGTAPISDPQPLPGPVTALWPSEARGQTTLVVRNLQSGEYEAYRLGLGCSQ